MDAKSKASFINSVAGGQGIPCPNCGTKNEPDRKSCICCGTEIVAKAAANDVSVFAPIDDDPQQETEKAAKYAEPASVFADGLPSWDIVPPQVMVRRH